MDVINIKIAIELIKVKDPDNIVRYRATISFQNAIDEPISTQKLIEIQNNYDTTIEECKKVYEHIKNNKRNQSNPIFRWELANKIFLFVKDLENNGYIFANFTDAMIRDLELSQTYVNKLLTLRRYYPSKDMLNTNINWSKYREILEISNQDYREKCVARIITGEIKTERQIREYKREIKKAKMHKILKNGKT